MRYEFKPSFDRSIKGLPPNEKGILLGACFEFLDLMEAKLPVSSGIGLKRLHGDYWEIRKGLGHRILFRWREATIEFILAGSHDSIKRFLLLKSVFDDNLHKLFTNS